MNDDKETKYVDQGVDQVNIQNHDNIQQGLVSDNADQLQRRLGNRQIQLIAIGGSIGTALFVSIGGGLARGGPLSLFSPTPSTAVSSLSSTTASLK